MERKWETRAAKVICAAAVGVAVLFVARLLCNVLLPFLLAWLLSRLIAPIAERLAKKTHLPHAFWAVILLVASLGGLIAALSAGIARGIEELQALLADLLQNGIPTDNGTTENFNWFEKLSAAVGLSEFGTRHTALQAEFNTMVNEALSSLATSLSAKLPSVAGKLISAMPAMLLFVVVTVISGFYFCLEPQIVGHFLETHLPHAIAARVPRWRANVKAISFRYLRAYLLILFATFAELLVGFLILRVKYAFLLSLVVAVVDILPVLGVGTVLIPWSIILLIQKDLYRGFGLLILYAAITVLRQMIEPRLVGKSLGLHPLATLVAGYVGWQLFGFLGMALGPLAALAVKAVLRGRAAPPSDPQ